MKKVLLVVGIVLLIMNVNAQVGINAGEDPKGTFEVGYDTEWAKTSKAQGIIPPKMTTAQRKAMQGIVAGLMIYNTDYNCLQVYNGTFWQCSDGTKKEFSNGATAATVTLGTMDPLRWVALEDNGTYYSFPKNGIANNASIPVEIPYSNATNGAYIAYEETFALPDLYGSQKQFKLSYPTGTINSATGTITATLTNVSGDIYYSQPQVPNGQWVDLATPQITFNGASATSYAIQATGGVLDRCFGKTTQQCVGYGANDKKHQFIYIPITGPDGKVWLNNNLGADYANVEHDFFDPAKQATSREDYHAYGSLFQWQRKADGHELMGWHSEEDKNPTNTGTTSTLAPSWTNAGTDKFILGRSSNDWNWVSNGSSDTSGPNVELWRVNGANNPCPVGYHVPTRREWVAYNDAVTGSGTSSSDGDFWDSFNADVLRLPAAGLRDAYDGDLGGGYTSPSRDGYYWANRSLRYDGEYSYTFKFDSSTSNTDQGIPRPNGGSLRCLKD